MTEQSNWRSRAVPVQGWRENAVKLTDAPRYQAAEFAEEHPYIRGAGRAARSIAGALTGALDLVNLPAKAAASGAGYLTGNEALSEFGASPGIRDMALATIDKATGNRLQPLTPLENVVDFASEMAVPLGGAKVATQADKISDIGKMLVNPSGAVETIAKRAMPTPQMVPFGYTTKPLSFKDVKAAASRAYKEADELGGVVTPEGSNLFITKMLRDAAEENPRVSRVFNDGPVADLIAKLKREYAGKPMTLDDISALDQKLTKELSRYFSKVDGASPEYIPIKAMQTALRNAVEESADNPALIQGSREGIDAYRRGAMLYGKAKRLEEVDDIVQKSLGQQQPARALRRGFDRLRRQKGFGRFSKEEQTIIDTIANENLGDDAVKILTGRLTGIIGVSAGGPVTGGSLYAAGAGARKLEKSGQLLKVDKLQREIVKGTGLMEKITPKDAKILEKRGLLNVLMIETPKYFSPEGE